MTLSTFLCLLSAAFASEPVHTAGATTMWVDPMISTIATFEASAKVRSTTATQGERTIPTTVAGTTVDLDLTGVDAGTLQLKVATGSKKKPREQVIAIDVIPNFFARYDALRDRFRNAAEGTPETELRTVIDTLCALTGATLDGSPIVARDDLTAAQRLAEAEAIAAKWTLTPPPP
jgi:hypothetical protein